MNHRPNEHGRSNEVDSADARDATFDAAARAAHDAALQRVSARVQAQLHQRRRAALSERAAAPRALWPMLVVGGTAALALAIGLRFANDGADPSDPSATSAQSVASSATSTGEPTVAPNAVATSDAPAPNTATDEDTALAEIERLIDDDGLDDDTLLAANDDGIFAALDENPDLYLWLGSNEGLAGTTESL